MLKILSNYRLSRSVKCLLAQQPAASFFTSKNLIKNQENFDISDEVVHIIEKRQQHPIFEYKPNKQLIVKNTTNLKLMKEELQQYFNCSDAEIDKFVKYNKGMVQLSLKKIIRKIEFLQSQNIHNKTILENSWMIEVSEEIIGDKLILINKLDPIKINDFAPFIRNSQQQLNKLRIIFKKERFMIPEGNRVYYFSQKAQIDPMYVSKYFSQRLFMFEIPYRQFTTNLDIMLKYGIEPMNILVDLWGFKYPSDFVDQRLERCREASKINIRPWAIRCQEDTLKKSLELSRTSKELLDGKANTDYIAERLGYDKEIIEGLASKNTQIYKLKPIRIKEYLDYFLIEKKVEPYQIAAFIRIFCYSLKNIKKRYEELERIGFKLTTLTFLCRAKSDYERIVRAWKKSQNITE